MRDALEERLAARLGALGDTVADELPPPVDLEFQVAAPPPAHAGDAALVERRRSRPRSSPRWRRSRSCTARPAADDPGRDVVDHDRVAAVGRAAAGHA